MMSIMAVSAKCDTIAHCPNNIGMSAAVVSGFKIKSDHEFFEAFFVMGLKVFCRTAPLAAPVAIFYSFRPVDILGHLANRFVKIRATTFPKIVVFASVLGAPSSNLIRILSAPLFVTFRCLFTRRSLMWSPQPSAVSLLATKR